MWPRYATSRVWSSDTGFWKEGARFLRKGQGVQSRGLICPLLITHAMNVVYFIGFCYRFTLFHEKWIQLLILFVHQKVFILLNQSMNVYDGPLTYEIVLRQTASFNEANNHLSVGYFSTWVQKSPLTIHLKPVVNWYQCNYISEGIRPTERHFNYIHLGILCDKNKDLSTLQAYRIISLNESNVPFFKRVARLLINHTQWFGTCCMYVFNDREGSDCPKKPHRAKVKIKSKHYE